MVSSFVRSASYLVVGLFFGIVVAVTALAVVCFAPLQLDHKITEAVGISKTQTIGFLPYFLLDKATDSYTDKLTTLTYFGLALSGDGTVVKLQNPQEEEPGWTHLKSKEVTTRLQKAKSNGTTLSLLVHTGDEDTISQLLQNPTQNAKNLVTSVAPLMKQYGFSDLNVDIESFSDATSSSRIRFTTFIRSVKNEMDAQNLGTLTVDMSPSVFIKPFLIDGETVGEIADYVVLMTYDYHYIGSYIAGPVAPLNGAPEVREFDVETGVQEALNKIPKEKLILGIPSYGYEWETLNALPGSPVIPASGGTASSRRLAEQIKTCKNCTTGSEEYGAEPYLIYPQDDGSFKQAFYENTASLDDKISLVQKYKLGGAAVWALGYDEPNMLTPFQKIKGKVQLLH